MASLQTLRLLKIRLASARTAFLTHLSLTLIVAVLAGLLVFQLWYPPPLYRVSQGLDILFILVIADVVCGPLITLIIYSPKKSRRELMLDFSIIGLAQLSLLLYGMFTLYSARPVFIAFEYDRFRVVKASDIDPSKISLAPPELRELSHTGPRFLAAKQLEPGSKEYLQSLAMAATGTHPAYQPSRWEAYSSQQSKVRAAAKPLMSLPGAKDRRSEFERRAQEWGVAIDDIGYIPLVAARNEDWVLAIKRSNGQILGYLPGDGWSSSR
jgi:hypothetical protein